MLPDVVDTIGRPVGLEHAHGERAVSVGERVGVSSGDEHAVDRACTTSPARTWMSVAPRSIGALDERVEQLLERAGLEGGPPARGAGRAGDRGAAAQGCGAAVAPGPLCVFVGIGGTGDRNTPHAHRRADGDRR